MRACVRILLIVSGTLFVALGLVGAFIPLLPTTPFLLLAAGCYVRSSPRLYRWLMTHRIFGAYIYNYVTYKAVRRSTRIGTLVLLWVTLLLSFLAVANLHARIFLLLVGIGVTTHLCMLKTMPDEAFQSSPKDIEVDNSF